MIDLATALQIVSENTPLLDTVRLRLGEAMGRVLAEGVTTDIDQPPFDRAMMDGFAVRVGTHKLASQREGKNGGEADTSPAPDTFQVVGQVAAGESPRTSLKDGQAVQINTGAPIPQGAESVVRVERTRLSDDGQSVTVFDRVEPGQFITRRGSYKKAGDVVLEKGARLSPANLAAAAAAGAAMVQVCSRPRVAILVTGNELVDVDRVPGPGQIRNSNQYLLESLVRSSQCDPSLMRMVGDTVEGLTTAIQGVSGCDMICITGGVSMGQFDFVPEVLIRLGATVHFHKVSIKPGRPTLFATLPGGQLVFALPGNPGSVFVAYHLMVKPALARMQGQRGAGGSVQEQNVPPLRAVLKGELQKEGSRRAYYPARLDPGPNGELHARLLSWHGSGDALGLAGVEALIERPPDSPPVRDGDPVQVLLVSCFPT